MQPAPATRMSQGPVRLCIRSQRAVAGLMLGLLAGILPSPAIGQNPDLAEPWRPMFKRPTGPPPAAPENPLTPDKIALAHGCFRTLGSLPIVSARARAAMSPPGPLQMGVGARL